MDMIDSEGYRRNVGIILCNRLGRLLWAKRIGQSGWQFPQGGIHAGESLEQALYRELQEELGLVAEDVQVLHRTQDWLHYRLPDNFIRRDNFPVCIGQKQKWFLLGLQADDSSIVLDRSALPEFDEWCWVQYWYPVHEVIEFKREVYRRALQELLKPMRRYLSQSSGSATPGRVLTDSL